MAGGSSLLRGLATVISHATGLDVKNNFAIIRPTQTGEYALYLWAVLNSREFMFNH